MTALALLRLGLALAFVGLLGYGALWLIDALAAAAERPTRPAAGGPVRRLGYAFALGMGVVASGMLVVSALHVQISFTAVILFGAFPVGAFLASRRARRYCRGEAGSVGAVLDSRPRDAGVRDPGSAHPERRSPLPGAPVLQGTDPLPRRLAVVLLGAAVAVVVLTCFLEPVVEVDPTAGWALHAKIFYYERTALPQFLTSGAAGPYVSHWPPVVPLVQAWGHIAMGAYDDHAIKLVFAAAFLALLALVYGTLREYLASSNALVVVFLLATVPAIAVPFPAGSVASAYADVPFALFITGAAASLAAWAQTRRGSAVALAGLLTAFAIWVKVEGLAFAAVSTACVWLFWAARRARGRPRGEACEGGGARPDRGVSHPLLYSLLILASLALYALYAAQFRASLAGAALDPGKVLAPATFVAAAKLAGYACLEAVNPSRWGFVWILGTLLVIFRSSRLKRPVIAMPLVLVLGQVACAIGVMAASGLSPEYWAYLTLRRTLIHVVPTAVMVVGLLASVSSGDSLEDALDDPRGDVPGEPDRAGPATAD